MKTPEEKREYQKKYQEINREKLMIQQHIRNMDNREARQRWYKDNIEHRKQWVSDNKEKIRIGQLEWREKHPDYHKLYQEKNREKIRDYYTKKHPNGKSMRGLQEENGSLTK